MAVVSHWGTSYLIQHKNPSFFFIFFILHITTEAVSPFRGVVRKREADTDVCEASAECHVLPYNWSVVYVSELP